MLTYERCPLEQFLLQQPKVHLKILPIQLNSCNQTNIKNLFSGYFEGKFSLKFGNFPFKTRKKSSHLKEKTKLQPINLCLYKSKKHEKLSSLENFPPEKKVREKSEKCARHNTCYYVYQHRVDWTTSDHLLLPTTNAIMALAFPPLRCRHAPLNAHRQTLSMHFIAFCRTGSRRTLSFQWQPTLQCLLFILWSSPLPPPLFFPVPLFAFSQSPSLRPNCSLGRWSIQLSNGLSMQIFLFASVFMLVKASMSALAGSARLVFTLYLMVVHTTQLKYT